LRDWLLFAFFLQVFGLLELLLEAVDASLGIHQLLAAGEERVAVRTNFNAQVALMRGTCLEGVPAGADNVYFFVGGMNTGFHFQLIPFETPPMGRKPDEGGEISITNTNPRIAEKQCGGT